jgi:hypothetical protein
VSPEALLVQPIAAEIRVDRYDLFLFSRPFEGDLRREHETVHAPRRRCASSREVLDFSAMRNSTLAQMRSLALQRGGECISRRYINSRIPLRWRCRRGHQWKAMPTNVSKGSWCPVCAHRKRLTLGEMRALAAHRGGECLSNQYANNETKLRWRCAAGHEWSAAPGLVKGGRWCPHCARVARLSLEAMVEIAASRGGRCLSTEYVNVETHLLWRCEAGHEWTTSPASIRSGRWCPYCVHNYSRRLRFPGRSDRPFPNSLCVPPDGGRDTAHRDARAGGRTRWSLSVPSSSPALARIQRVRRLSVRQTVYIYKG